MFAGGGGGDSRVPLLLYESLACAIGSNSPANEGGLLQSHRRLCSHLLTNSSASTIHNRPTTQQASFPVSMPNMIHIAGVLHHHHHHGEALVIAFFLQS